MSKSADQVREALEETLSAIGFGPPKRALTLEHPRVLGAWVRKTWNTNRAVVLLEAPPAEGPTRANLAELGQASKKALAKQLGYLFFLYTVGIQVVWVGEGLRGEGSAKEASSGVQGEAAPANPYAPPAAPLERRPPSFGELEKGVDRFDNQWGIIQSVFVFDLDTGERWQARTWGQVVTGRFQDAIWETLKRLNTE